MDRTRNLRSIMSIDVTPSRVGPPGPDPARYGFIYWPKWCLL